MKSGILIQSSIPQDITNHEFSPSLASFACNLGQFGQDLVENGSILAKTSANVSADTLEFDFDLDKHGGNDIDTNIQTPNPHEGHTVNSKGGHTLNPHGHAPTPHVPTSNCHVIPPLIPKEKDPIDKENVDPGENLCMQHLNYIVVQFSGRVLKIESTASRFLLKNQFYLERYSLI